MVFAPVGRMALSNYLMQTFIAIILFYGVGFGLGLHMGLATVLLIAVAVYIFQMLFSALWFRIFNFGPLEWIWRQLTYGRLLKMKK